MTYIEQFNVLLNTTNEERYQRWIDFRKKIDASLLNVIERLPVRETAVVVGAGRCEDFSLIKLVNSFDKVILADIDLESIVDSVAYKELKKTERGKVELLKIDFTGVENSGLFINLEARLRAADNFDSIEKIINTGFGDIAKYRFLKNSYKEADLTFVSPIYTQFIYQQLMLTVGKLRSTGYPENLLKYIENLVSDKLVSVFKMFNDNLRKVTRGYLVVASDIFQDYSDSDFMINIKKNFNNEEIDKIYEQYHSDYGFGMGDLGLFLLNDLMELESSEWLLWPFSSKSDMVVKLSIYK